MTYKTYSYTWIYYCTHWYLSKFLETKNWKFFTIYNLKFGFRLNVGDIYKTIFAMSLKHENIFMVFFTNFYIAYSLKSFLKGHVLN
jgi:hypothetical protein